MRHLFRFGTFKNFVKIFKKCVIYLQSCGIKTIGSIKTKQTLESSRTLGRVCTYHGDTLS